MGPWLKRRQTVDEEQCGKEPWDEDDEDDDGGLDDVGNPASDAPFPLFRRFASEARGKERLEVQEVQPQWKNAGGRHFRYGKRAWSALSWYWATVRIDRDAEAEAGAAAESSREAFASVTRPGIDLNSIQKE